MTDIVSKPDHGVALVDKEGKALPAFQLYLDDLTTKLNDNLLGLRIQATSYTVDDLPDATTEAGIIYVSDDAGGGVLAFTDGTNWLRCTDRTIVAT